MFESIKGFFHSEHAALLDNQADMKAMWAQRWAGLNAEISALASDSSYQLVLRAKAVEKQIDELKGKLDAERCDFERRLRTLQYQIGRAADPAIAKFQKWCRDEIDRDNREVMSQGRVERGSLGITRAWLKSNAEKIVQRRDALNNAIEQADTLRYASQADVGRQIKEIKAGIPESDVEPVEVEASPGIADALSGPTGMK
jgi:hypothetical protein